MKIGESFSRQFSIHSSIIYGSINHCLLPHYLHTSKSCYAECFKLINLCLMAQHNRNFSCLFSFRLLNMLTCVYLFTAFRIFIFSIVLSLLSIIVRMYVLVILHNFIWTKIGDLLHLNSERYICKKSISLHSHVVLHSYKPKYRCRGVIGCDIVELYLRNYLHKRCKINCLRHEGKMKPLV